MYPINYFIFIRCKYISIVFLSLVLKAELSAAPTYPLVKENYFFLTEGIISDNESTCTLTNPVNGGSFANVASGTALASDFWIEDFTLPNDYVADLGTTGWSVITAGDGVFSVQSNEFKASFNSANEGVWAPDFIDISDQIDVSVSAYLRSSTASSNDYFESDDYIGVYYKLNDGAETLIFGNAAGLNGVNNGTPSTNVTSSAINGNTLQIVIRARNSHSTERCYFDNVKLTGIPITIEVNASALVDGTLACTNNFATLLGSSNTTNMVFIFSALCIYIE